MKLTKKNWIFLGVGIGLIAISLISLLVVKLVERKNTLNFLDHTLSVEAKQIDKTQKINVSWETDKLIDSVTIEVKHGEDIVNKVEIHNPTIILQGNYQIDAFYGKQTVNVTTYNAQDKYEVTKTKTVECNLWTDKYVIAPIPATMAVTMFTLDLETITDNYQTPTFVWFKRSGVWNYNEMPNNVQLIPVLATDDFEHEKHESIIYEKVSRWVGELYEINPNSKFDFYINDIYGYGWMEATYGNNIPIENYHVTLLSDGLGSFGHFNINFDNENAEARYAEMKQLYDEVKQGLKTDIDYIRKRPEILATRLRQHAYLMVKEEPNVEWWLTRVSKTMANNNAEVYEDLNNLVTAGKIRVVNFNNILATYNEQEKEELKNLFNFNSDVFESAVEQNKKVMIFLGTWDKDETYFTEYMEILSHIYGEEFVIYYKGHPYSPTTTIEGKMEKLESMGLVDINSTIPAELLFFFNPEAYASGYTSSTFLSISDEKTVSIVHSNMEDFTQTYKPNVDNFISKVENTDEKYGSLVSSNNCFVVEFAKVETYDIAIYDASAKTMKYYKKNGTTYNQVSA